VSDMKAEWTEIERQEVIAEALHHPETLAESAAQQVKFRAWLRDPRYQHLWAMLERLVTTPAVTANEAAPQSSRIAP
jgi:hypothetical protein